MDIGTNAGVLSGLLYSSVYVVGHGWSTRRGNPMLLGVFPHVGVRRWIDPPAGSAVDVPVHVPGRSFSDVLQALIFGWMGMHHLV
jgi:CubicO group peptidase (beta-lactamase class C family)